MYKAGTTISPLLDELEGLVEVFHDVFGLHVHDGDVHVLDQIVFQIQLCPRRSMGLARGIQRRNVDKWVGSKRKCVRTIS